jgi:hypothetical protein
LPFRQVKAVPLVEKLEIFVFFMNFLGNLVDLNNFAGTHAPCFDNALFIIPSREGLIELGGTLNVAFGIETKSPPTKVMAPIT